MKNSKRRAKPNVTQAVKVVEVRQQPQFDHNTVVTIRSLVVDKFGVPWWVDPDARSITKAAGG